MLVALLQFGLPQESIDKIECLYDQYERLLFHIAKGILHGDMLAEDAVNETFLRLIKYSNTILKKRQMSCPHMRNYLVVMVKNVCKDFSNTSVKRNEIMTVDKLSSVQGSSGLVDGSTEEILFQQYDVNVLREALHTLPWEHQRALLLHVFEEMTVEEVAEAMNCKPETAKKRIYRARKALKEALEVHDG